MLSSYENNTFTGDYYTTLGTDFVTKIVDVDNVLVKAYIWDTAGQERFRTATRAFYQRAQGILLVYDMTETKTFATLAQWLENISQCAGQVLVKYLVANKADKEADRKVTRVQGKALADEHNMLYFETSAKTNANVSTVFESIIRETYIASKAVPVDKSFKLSVDPTVKPKSRCCSGSSSGSGSGSGS